MSIRKTLMHVFIHSRFPGKGNLGYTLVALTCLGLGQGEILARTAASCDAVAGATFSVVGITTTLNSASITWKETYRNEKRFFCQGIGTPATCVEVSSRAAGNKVQVASGLTANTKYAYKFYLNYKGKIKSVVSGTFTTDNSSCGTGPVTVPTVEIDGVVVSNTKDSLENVIAKLTRQSDGSLVKQDTTDKYGHYFFNLNPGTYLLNFSYPPYTAPTALTVVVEAGKPKDLPDQIMINAFLLRGTVVSDGKGDSLVGAKITLHKKADNSIIATRISDEDGQFSMGVLAGEYSVNVNYSGKAMMPALSVNISQNTNLNKLVFKQTVRLFSPAKSRLGLVPSANQDLFDLKGSSIENTVPTQGKRSSTVIVPRVR